MWLYDAGCFTTWHIPRPLQMVEAQSRPRSAEGEAGVACRGARPEGQATSMVEMAGSRKGVADLETALDGLERRCEEQASDPCVLPRTSFLLMLASLG